MGVFSRLDYAMKETAVLASRKAAVKERVRVTMGNYRLITQIMDKFLEGKKLKKAETKILRGVFKVAGVVFPEKRGRKA